VLVFVPDPLRGACLKLERAAYLVSDLRSNIEQFLQTNPFRISRDDDPGTGHRLYRVRFEADPPEYLGPIVGDAVHNLRSSLDHMVSAVARTAGQRDDRTSFPSFTEPQCWEDRGLRDLGKLPSNALTTIKGLQPYHTPEARKHVLYLLNSLWNHDKHRDIVLTGWCVARAGFDQSDPGKVPIMASGVIEDGAVILRDPPPHNVDPRTVFDFDVAFGPGSHPAVEGMRVVSVLELIDQWIRHEVLPRFAELFPDG